MKTRFLIRSAVIALAVLLIPFIAMQFTSEVNWSLSDFVIMGTLLFTTILGFTVAASSRGSNAYRVATFIAIGCAFLLICVNLAVGILGSGPNYANLMYGGMIVIGISGAVLSRFRADGMARTMITMGIAQVLVPVIALIIFQLERVNGESFEDGIVVVGVTAFFGALWFLSAMLFRRAAAMQITEVGV